MSTRPASFGFTRALRTPLLCLALTASPLAAAAAPSGSGAGGTDGADRPLERFVQQAQEAGVPIAFAAPLAQRLQVVWHDADALSPAFFLPPGTETALLESWLLEGDGDRGAAQPRLMLYGPIYRAPGPAVAPPQELAVDAVEYIFHALTQAYFALDMPSEGDFSAAVDRRAATLLAAQPPERRREAYLQAGAAFVSHLLAVANQLERSSALHRERGSNLCRHFDRPWTLFRLWDAIFQREGYRARWYRGAGEAALPSAGKGGGAGWVDTGVNLEREDKMLLVRYLLAGAYEGTKEEDLAPRFCPAEPDTSGPDASGTDGEADGAGA